MAELIKMPKMSDTMTEGLLAKWHKSVGDQIKPGDVLAEVETDKATMELESYQEGTILHIGVEENQSIPVDAVLAVIGTKGEDISSLLTQISAEQKTPEVTVESPKDTPVPQPVVTKAPEVKKDVETKATSSPSPSSAPNEKTAKATSSPSSFNKESFVDKPVGQMRKAIAKKVADSMYSAPHFYMTVEINMDNAIEERKNINALSPVKVSFNDLVIKAAAVALRMHPQVNASWLGDKIRFYDYVNISVAIAVEDGVLMPIVRFADEKSLAQISSEVKDLGARAKSKKLLPADSMGSTFSISNLGMFGIEEFTGIINSPNAAILAVGGIKETTVVKNGQMQIGNVMKVTLSCDHRVLDGASGAPFLQTLKNLLEEPIRLLL